MSTNKSVIEVSFLIIFLLTGIGVYAQSPALFKDSTNYISAGISSDAFLSLDIEYLRKAVMNDEYQSHYFYGGMQLPVSLNLSGKGNMALKIYSGYRYELLASDKFSIGGELRMFIARHKNVLGNFVPFGCDFKLSPCFISGKSSIGIYMEWSNIFATYIKHSEYSGAGFSDLPGPDSRYSSPFDGWYSDTGSIFKWGVNYSRKCGQKMVLAFDLALVNHRSELTGYLDAMMIGQIPMEMRVRLIHSIGDN